MPNGVWKWVAAVLVAVMLAGAPAIIQAIKAPSRDEVNLIRERQNTVLQRLAVIETEIQQQRELQEQLFAELRAHEATTAGH